MGSTNLSVIVAQESYALTADSLKAIVESASRTGKALLGVDGLGKYEVSREEIKDGITGRLLEYQLAVFAKTGKSERCQVVFEAEGALSIGPVDFEDLLNKFHVRRAGFQIAYVIFPLAKRILNVLKDKYKTVVLKDYEQIQIPKYTTIDVFKRSGHIRLPPKTYLLSKFNGAHHAELQEEAYLYKSWSNTEKRCTCIGVSTIGQCQPFWPSLERQTLNMANLPLKFFDVSGYMLRNQGNAVHCFKRLDLLSRVQAITIAKNQGQAMSLVLMHLEHVREYLGMIGLKFRILTVTSWLPAIGKQHVSTYDFEACLPSTEECLQVGNISYTHRAFTANFDIGLQGGGRPVSACAGLGLTRISDALILQKRI